MYKNINENKKLQITDDCSWCIHGHVGIDFIHEIIKIIIEEHFKNYITNKNAIYNENTFKDKLFDVWALLAYKEKVIYPKEIIDVFQIS